MIQVKYKIFMKPLMFSVMSDFRAKISKALLFLFIVVSTMSTKKGFLINCSKLPPHNVICKAIGKLFVSHQIPQIS